MTSPLFRDTLNKPEPLRCQRCGTEITTAEAEGCDDCGATFCNNRALEHDLEECD